MDVKNNILMFSSEKKILNGKKEQEDLNTFIVKRCEKIYLIWKLLRIDLSLKSNMENNLI